IPGTRLHGGTHAAPGAGGADRRLLAALRRLLGWSGADGGLAHHGRPDQLHHVPAHRLGVPPHAEDAPRGVAARSAAAGEAPLSIAYKVGSITRTPPKPASGRLGVLLPGLGAVATTLIAGVELARRGLGRPIGSLTQMGTIRLGKRTENRVPKIHDFAPLSS